jgi:hypothetical protein
VLARGLFRNGAQLAGLWALAVAQPLFAVTKSGQPFVAAGWRGGDIVLFAVGVAFGPPLLLLAIEGAAGLIRPALQVAVHVAFVGMIAAVLALYAIKHESTLRTGPSLAIGLVAGVVAGYLFRRFDPVRSFVTVLAPASLLVLGLFLLVSPTRTLVFPSEGANLAGPRPSAPLVMIVFDEFPTLSLLDARGGLDGATYPAFAQLARGGTWFRNATTVADGTDQAVPAILTGRRQGATGAASVSAYPDNLLALFGRRGGVDAREAFTRLCPRDLCPVNAPRPFPDRVRRRLKGLVRLSLATFLPDGLYRHVLAPERPYPFTREENAFRRFMANFQRPVSLHFLHAFLPHQPWHGLPSGRHYEPLPTNRLRDFAPFVPKVPRAVFPRLRWTRDRARVTHMLQRHLAQARYADTLLGRALRRLRDTGLWDRAMVVVTADHGIAFDPSQDARNLTRRTAPRIVFVPLFIKLPDQRTGSTSDRFVRSIDLVPTIAAALKLHIPWRTEGSSVFRATPARRRLAPFVGETHETLDFDGPALERRLRAAASEQAALFEGHDPDRIFRAGPQRALIGRSVNGLTRAPASRLRYALDGPKSYVNPRSRLVPAVVTGRLSGPHAAGRQLVLALNGTVAGSPVSHPSDSGVRFEALVAERLLRPGLNRVTLYEAAQGGPDGPRLSEIARASPRRG